MNYTETELNNMLNTFLEESGFYDYEWKYGLGSLKKDILLWKKGTKHQDILDWFDSNLENDLEGYIRINWEFWKDEVDKCMDCPKLISCSKCTF